MTKTTTGDQALIKRINTAIVLEAILREEPLSRAKISEVTGLNKATVSSLVQDLIDNQLVREIGTGVSSGGRKPVMLEFISTAGYSVGIDLGVNYLRGVLTDLRGAVVAERREPLSASDPDDVFNVLRPFIRSLISEAPDSPFGVVGIGVGVPGLVDSSGSVLYAPNMNWREVPLKDALSRTFGIPVLIDNEANVGALGERTFGSGRGVSNMVYVSVGIGIGTGLILQRTLYKGSSGFSGELGHLSVEAHGKPCRCGNRGCWELYASEQALLEQARELGFPGDLDELLAAAEAGDEKVRMLLAGIGEYLGVGIANIVNIFNPDAVIIGNRMSRAQPWIEDAVGKTLEERALNFHLRGVQLLFAELGGRSAVMGAAELSIAAFFDRLKAS
ncbi:ROK family transcriptional regulator [Cohnella thailandensis]|uniref:ROK family transcriptional regulator n=1 Tax=Cohnella thailandensis TaxID=557557 RepID=A0A841T575_9BACL|nr:ROK family transcriptional regulator [Cohnella thailandensis]MBB6637240.1 ROK family transcriptional regulator [Cohnella thailandensis]MBP1976915.1 putative NBD/HSP70 family sugar kinase [Cohnella thailandensis]